MNRYDWIRSKSNDELLNFLRMVMLFKCEACCSYERFCRREGVEEDVCLLGVEQWLKQEVLDKECVSSGR